MRRLVFNPGDDQRRFMLLYQALCFAPGKLDGKGELRTHGILLGKLEGIAVVSNPGRGPDEPALYRCPGGGEIVATEPEYSIAKRFLLAYIDNIPRGLSRELEAAITWMENVAELPEVAPPAAAESGGPEKPVENSVTK